VNWLFELHTVSSAGFQEFGVPLYFMAFELSVDASCLPLSQWLLAGVCATILSFALVGIFAPRIEDELPELSGLMAGNMIDPIALVFASNGVRFDAPTPAHARVCLLTTPSASFHHRS
jgi:hypothetical protein